jgi:hypothetical protein
MKIEKIIEILASKGITTEIISPEKNIKKDGTSMDYTAPKKLDSHVRVKFSPESWNSVLNKGLYSGFVYQEPTFKPAKNADPLNPQSFNLIVPIQLTDGDNKGKKSNFLATLTEKSAGRFKRVFDNIGFKYAIDEAGNIDFDTKDLLNVQLKANITEDTWNGKTENKITMIFNKDYAPES